MARHPFVLGDVTVVAIAAGTLAGARVGGGPGILVAAAVLAVGVAGRRAVLLGLGLALLGAGLADRALAGLDPVVAGPAEGWITLVGDPEPIDGGGVRVDVRLRGQVLEASAFAAAAARLEDRLAGEHASIRGRLRPPPADAPWLVPRRVVGRLSIDEVLDVAGGSPAASAANGFRRTLAAGAAGLSPTARSLLAGVVLGDGRDQPPELTDDFRAAGLAHLLVVSGQNVAFVLVAAGPILTRLRWRTRLPATLLVLGAFALLVRFEPSVLRAVAMAVVATLAAATGRPSAGVRILAVAVTALVLVDPLLVRSVGFGLSVSASAAILVLAPRLRLAIGGPRLLAEPLSVTVAAQIGTAPLLLATFGPLPVAAVPANLLAVPAAAPLMVWGLTAGVIAGLLPAGVATVLHVPTSILTWWLARAAAWAAALPLGAIALPHAVALAGAAAGAVLLRRRRWAGAVTVLVLVLAALGRPRVAAGATPIGDAGTLWAEGGATVLVLDGRGPADRSLEALRWAGTRCVDVVAFDGGGPGTITLAAALLRRCPDAVAIAARGEARPGWIALAPAETAAVGSLQLRAGPDGTIAVVDPLGSGDDARAPRRRRRRARPGAVHRRGVGGRVRRRVRRWRRVPARGPPGAGGDRGDPGSSLTVATPAPVHLVRGDDPSLVRDAVRSLVDELVGDGDRTLMVDEHAGDGYDPGALADAAQTPPFLTDRRVVVGRDLHQFKADALAPLVHYLADPLPTTSLVLVWESGAVPKGLADAIKKAGGISVDANPGRTAKDQRGWLADRVSASGLHLDRGAVEALAQNLGQDVSRLSGILATLTATYGDGAKLSAADVEPYLGEAGGVAPWDLTDAIDRGDIPAAVAQLHRFHGPGRPAYMVMGALHSHVQRMLALDGAAIGGEKDAAAVLGMKGSTFPAKKALDQTRRLGSDKVAQAVKLLAEADRDLRGHKDWPDELVLEVLVARLAFLARR